MKVLGRALVVVALLAMLAVVALPSFAQVYPLPPPEPLDYLNPFPVVRLAGTTNSTGARITLLSVRSPRDSQVTLRCKGGRKKGCPYKSKTRTSPRSRLLRFKEMRRKLKAGVRLRIFVRRGETIGKYTSFTIRRKKPPRRSDSCLFPGDPFEPRECP